MHFSQLSTDFVDWNVQKDQQGKNLLSSRLSEETLVVVQFKKVWI